MELDLPSSSQVSQNSSIPISNSNLKSDSLSSKATQILVLFKEFNEKWANIKLPNQSIEFIPVFSYKLSPTVSIKPIETPRVSALLVTSAKTVQFIELFHNSFSAAIFQSFFGCSFENILKLPIFCLGYATKVALEKLKCCNIFSSESAITAQLVLDNVFLPWYNQQKQFYTVIYPGSKDTRKSVSEWFESKDIHCTQRTLYQPEPIDPKVIKNKIKNLKNISSLVLFSPKGVEYFSLNLAPYFIQKKICVPIFTIGPVSLKQAIYLSLNKDFPLNCLKTPTPQGLYDILKNKIK